MKNNEEGKGEAVAPADSTVHVCEQIKKDDLRYLLNEFVAILRPFPPKDSYDIGWDEGAFSIIQSIASRFRITLEE